MAFSIVEKLDAYIAAQIKIQPRSANRASDIGDPCLRKLVYWRLNWKEAKAPSLALQYIFEEGKEFEEKTTMKMLRAGLKLTRLQEPQFIEEAQLGGHPDGFMIHEDDARDYPYDIKSMSPHVWSTITVLEDMERYAWTKKYKKQLMAYMHASRREKGAFILGNKSTGRFKEIWVPYDKALMEEVFADCQVINKHVAAKTYPEKLQGCEECDDCAFLHLCMPDKIFNEPLFIKNPELEASIRKAVELRPAAKEFKALDEDIKEQLKAGLRTGHVGEKIQSFLGTIEISAAWRSRKAFSVKASDFWVIKYGGEE